MTVSAAQRQKSRSSGGYRIIVPPGWSHITISSGDAEVRRELDRAVPDEVSGEQRASWKAQVLSRVQPALDQARRVGAQDLFVPLRGMNGIAIPASFIVSAVPADEAEALRALRLRADVAGSIVVEIDGAEAVRQEGKRLAAELAADPALVVRTVTYLVRPLNSARILIFTFTTLGDGDPDGGFSDALVQLFDAVMATVRFEPPSNS